jgi:lysophospholipase L1-like esterase
VVIGDSISEGYGASSAGSTSWFSLLRNAIFSSQGENCSDAETVVSFFGLNQYGLTYGGSYAQGTAGPTKQSIILQPGASITFTGNFDYVDVFYTQSASSGTLLFLKDGVQYRSLSTAGSASPDICSFSGATSGGGASHTYTIQASTNPVEITGLIRLQSVSNSNGPQGRIHVSRQALAGVSSSYYAGSAATLASIVAQGSFYRAPSMYIVFLGTNNIYNSGAHTSPAQYEADLRTICDTIKKASADNRIMLCVPPVANEAAWTPFAPWGQYSQAVRRVSADFGTGVIDLGSIDFVGRGLTADGVHPNDAGHYLIYQRVMQSIANYLGVQDDCGGRTAFTPTFGRASGTVTVGYATQAGYYIRTPNICTFSCKIALNSMSSDGSGYLYVTLPFTAQAAFSEAFAIGQHTLAVGSGKQLLCETLPGSNIALLRGFDPVSGAYSEIGALTATSSVVISGTYAI